MAWSHQATIHYLNQCWSISLTSYGVTRQRSVNILRPRQNGRHFADDIFKCIFLNKNAWIALKISLKFVPTVQINNISALVQIMAWRRPGDKPLSEPMMVSLLTHICVTRPQWVDELPTLPSHFRHQFLWLTTGRVSLCFPRNHQRNRTWS